MNAQVIEKLTDINGKLLERVVVVVRHWVAQANSLSVNANQTNTGCERRITVNSGLQSRARTAIAQHNNLLTVEITDNDVTKIAATGEAKSTSRKEGVNFVGQGL